MNNHKTIDSIAQKQTAKFQTDQAFRFIECATNLAVHSAGLKATAAHLRKLADQIEDYG